MLCIPRYSNKFEFLLHFPTWKNVTLTQFFSLFCLFFVAVLICCFLFFLQAKKKHSESENFTHLGQSCSLLKIRGIGYGLDSMYFLEFEIKCTSYIRQRHGMLSLWFFLWNWHWGSFWRVSKKPNTLSSRLWKKYMHF